MTSDLRRALAAATEVTAALGLAVEKAHVLQQSNRLVVRLLPCDVLARVANEQESPWAEFELGLALRLAQSQAPIGVLEPRVTPDAYVRDGFVVTLWTYYETASSMASAPADYARALQTLHAEMRRIDMPTPHFTDRISEAQRLVGDRERSPALADADRDLLASTLQRLRQAVGTRRVPEQLLHGEPHPGNVLRTKCGLLFIDLQTCCRGPVEFDLAHVPEQVSIQYPRADRQLLHDCRLLMLAMVAAWRWDRNDQFPNGVQAAREYVSALREALSGAPVSAHGWF
jgi:aminoglycoside phosphotransferase (APT) family kinase protein